VRLHNGTMRWHTLTSRTFPAVGVRFPWCLAMLMIPVATFVSLFVMGWQLRRGRHLGRIILPLHPYSSVVAQTEDKDTLRSRVLYSTGQNNDRLGLLTAGAVVVVIPIPAILAVLSATPRPTHRGDRPQ
jgi:hypothetical protein